MKLLIFLFLLLSWEASVEAKIIEPMIDSSHKRVILGQDATRALSLWKADFSLYKFNDFMKPVQDLYGDSKDELPMIVKGNFNSDDINDVALIGRSEAKEFIVVLISDLKTHSYNVYQISESEASEPNTIKNNVEDKIFYGLNTYLSLLRASEILSMTRESRVSKQKITSPQITDVVQVEVYLSSVTQGYYFDGSKMIPFFGELK